MNAQAAVDAGAQIIVAHELTQCGNDQGQLVPRTRPTKTALFDAGYSAKHVTLSLALRSSGDAGRGFRRGRAAAALVA